MRIGHGYDVHRLVEGRSLVLGGVRIPFEKGLVGHSDADVLTHAVMDALLGAAALGDIGKLFPDTDDRYLGADSVALLREVDRRLTEAGYRLGNLDVTVIAQRPKLAPHIPAMRERIAAALGISPDAVSVKATTEESLGFTGKAAISPRHLGNINRCFSPTQAEVDHANEVLAALEEGKRQGRGAVALHGKMIDAPIAARAKRTLADAEQILKRGGTLA